MIKFWISAEKIKQFSISADNFRHQMTINHHKKDYHTELYLLEVFVNRWTCGTGPMSSTKVLDKIILKGVRV